MITADPNYAANMSGIILDALSDVMKSKNITDSNVYTMRGTQEEFMTFLDLLEIPGLVDQFQTTIRCTTQCHKCHYQQVIDTTTLGVTTTNDHVRPYHTGGPKRDLNEWLEVHESENSWTCPKCKLGQTAKTLNQVVVVRENIIILNTAPDRVREVTPYVMKFDGPNGKDYIYELVAGFCHIGNSTAYGATGGHHICYGMRGGVCWKFNDTVVSEETSGIPTSQCNMLLYTFVDI